MDIAILHLDYVVIFVYFSLFVYLILNKQKISLYRFMVSSIMAFIWMLIAKNEYGYNHDFLIVRGINLLPLFVWALGLFVIYTIYLRCQNSCSKNDFWPSFLLFLIFYWSALIVTETVAYHFLNVRNIAASAYKGLPICDCVHAPSWMQAAYFMMGPIYFIILQILTIS